MSRTPVPLLPNWYWDGIVSTAVSGFCSKPANATDAAIPATRIAPPMVKPIVNGLVHLMRPPGTRRAGEDQMSGCGAPTEPALTLYGLAHSAVYRAFAR